MKLFARRHESPARFLADAAIILRVLVFGIIERRDLRQKIYEKAFFARLDPAVAVAERADFINHPTLLSHFRKIEFHVFHVADCACVDLA